eukprot:Clim_evm9s216 gene=Clim_evmTU9s216
MVAANGKYHPMNGNGYALNGNHRGHSRVEVETHEQIELLLVSSVLAVAVINTAVFSASWMGSISTLSLGAAVVGTLAGGFDEFVLKGRQSRPNIFRTVNNHRLYTGACVASMLVSLLLIGAGRTAMLTRHTMDSAGVHAFVSGLRLHFYAILAVEMYVCAVLGRGLARFAIIGANRRCTNIGHSWPWLQALIVFSALFALFNVSVLLPRIDISSGMEQSIENPTTVTVTEDELRVVLESSFVGFWTSTAGMTLQWIAIGSGAFMSNWVPPYARGSFSFAEWLVLNRLVVLLGLEFVMTCLFVTGDAMGSGNHQELLNSLQVQTEEMVSYGDTYMHDVTLTTRRTEDIAVIEALVWGPIAVGTVVLSFFRIRDSSGKQSANSVEAQAQSPWRTAAFLGAFFVGLFGLIAPALTHALGGQSPVYWVLEFAFAGGGPRRFVLVMLWAVLVAVAVTVAARFVAEIKIMDKNLVRKGFHALLVLILMLGNLMGDHRLVSVGLGCAFAVFVLVELIRIGYFWPLGMAIDSFLQPYAISSRDSGPLIMSHFYLLIGCALPIWIMSPAVESVISARNVGTSVDIANNAKVAAYTAAYAGILSIGVGDAMAVLIGLKYGKMQWPGQSQSRTVLGSLAFVISSFLAFCIIVTIEELPVTRITEVSVLLSCILGALLEAYTPHNDNLFIPIFTIAALTVLI